MDPARELVMMQSFRELPETMVVKRGAYSPASNASWWNSCGRQWDDGGKRPRLEP